MKKLFTRPFLLSLIAVVLCTAAAYAEAKRVLLTDAIKNRLVTIHATSLGGAQGACLSLELRNRTAREIVVAVDRGATFRTAEESDFQHLVALGAEESHLEPYACDTLVLQTYCGRRAGSGPQADVAYNFWKTGGPLMAEALEYIHAHNLTGYIGQHAVWAFTDAQPVAHIYDYYTPERSKPLVVLMARLLKQPVPQAFVRTPIPSSRPGARYTPDPLEILVPLEWAADDARRADLRVTVYDPAGRLYRHITNGEARTAERHSLRVVFNPRRDAPGRYTILLRDSEARVWLQKTVEVPAV